MPLTILVTGGAGYVGSHTVLELLNVGHNVVCVDNLCNAFNEKGAALPEALRRVQIITGKNIIFYPVDIRDAAALTDIFKKVPAQIYCSLDLHKPHFTFFVNSISLI